MATDRTEKRPLEELIQQVTDWVDHLEQTGEVGELDPQDLKEVFEAFGANFEIGEDERKALRKYTNLGKADGMRAVWGDRFGQYKDWTLEFIQQFEMIGSQLPALETSGKKNSGMIHFFWGTNFVCSRGIVRRTF